MRVALFIFIILFVSACSSKTAPNHWQYQAKHAYSNFEKYFLEEKIDLAAIELDRARTHAKQSTDFTTLAHIELSACALHVALREPFTCKQYASLSPLIHNPQLQSYERFLASQFTHGDIANLPPQYRAFADYKLKGDATKMQESIIGMKSLISKMIAASLIEDKLTNESIQNIIDDASFHGYKYAVISWLILAIERSDDEHKALLEKKLAILRQ